MSAETLLAQVKGLEMQLAVLKAQLEALRPQMSPHTLADLEGLLEGEGPTTEKELEEAEYRAKWDGDEEEATCTGPTPA